MQVVYLYAYHIVLLQDNFAVICFPIKHVAFELIEQILVTDVNLAASMLYYIASRLFSLAANFPEFPEWAHNLEKFILGCCMKLDYGLPL